MNRIALLLVPALLLVASVPTATANDKLVCAESLCTRSYADLGCLAGLGVEGAPLSGSYGVALCPALDANATAGLEVMVCGGQPDFTCNHVDAVQRDGLVCIEDTVDPANPPVVLACAP